MGLIIGEPLKGKKVLTTSFISLSFVTIFSPVTNKGWRLPLTLLFTGKFTETFFSCLLLQEPKHVLVGLWPFQFSHCITS